MKCFMYHKKNSINCYKKNCKYWIKSNICNNCTLVGAKENKFTLQDIGEIFGVTRMRICQIEKIAINKIKEKLKI